MQVEMQHRCRRVGTCLDRIKDFDREVYQDVLFLLAAMFALDAENQELQAELRRRGEAVIL